MPRGGWMDDETFIKLLKREEKINKIKAIVLIIAGIMMFFGTIYGAAYMARSFSKALSVTIGQIVF